MWPLGLQILLGEATAPPQVREPHARPEHGPSEWLSLNDLTRGAVLRLLARIAPPPVPETGPGHRHNGLSAEAAWALCAHAMRRAFPGLAEEVNRTEAQTPKCVQPRADKHPKAFTYNLGHDRLPFVSLHYRDRPRDLLVMAHEFGHALQIVASAPLRTGQMPPIARECCAFLAELALIRHCSAARPALSAAHAADTAEYFGVDRLRLQHALQGARTPYRYDWNYPLARRRAADLMAQGTPKVLCALYRAGAEGGRQLNRDVHALGLEACAA